MPQNRFLRQHKICFLLLLSISVTANAQSPASVREIDLILKQFVAKPHPMGSPEQAKLAVDFSAKLSARGFNSRLQKFEVEVPNPKSKKYGGKSDFSSTPATLKVGGRNVIGTRPGRATCAVLVGGHYDTKFFENFKFVGANDGGSSTALILEVARLFGRSERKKSKDLMLSDCDLHLVLFDGEEATLTEWDDAKKMGFSQDDHLYGSNAFIQEIEFDKQDRAFILKKPILAVFIFDMVGHKNQKLQITRGSDKKISESFVNFAKRGKIEVSYIDESIEDDHAPFTARRIAVVHVIDWTNLNEWHTTRDNLDIVDSKKISRLATTFVDYLKETKYEK